MDGGDKPSGGDGRRRLAERYVCVYLFFVLCVCICVCVCVLRMEGSTYIYLRRGKKKGRGVWREMCVCVFGPPKIVVIG